MSDDFTLNFSLITQGVWQTPQNHFICLECSHTSYTEISSMSHSIGNHLNYGNEKFFQDENQVMQLLQTSEEVFGTWKKHLRWNEVLRKGAESRSLKFHRMSFDKLRKTATRKKVFKVGDRRIDLINKLVALENQESSHINSEEVTERSTNCKIYMISMKSF